MGREGSEEMFPTAAILCKMHCNYLSIPSPVEEKAISSPSSPSSSLLPSHSLQFLMMAEASSPSEGRAALEGLILIAQNIVTLSTEQHD